MDDISQQIRADLVEAVRWTATFAGRSAQTAIGPSEIGHPCDRRLAYKEAGRPPVTFPDPLAAYLGTGGHAVHEETFTTYGGESYDAWKRWTANPGDEEAFHAASLAPYRDNPRYEVESHVDIPGLPAGGTCDLFDRELSAVIDHKWIGAWSMNRARVHGPSAAYRVQAHTYGLGWEDRTGTPPKYVSIAFWPREKSRQYGVEVSLDYVWVWSEPYDRAVAEEALSRLAWVRANVAGMDLDRYPDLLLSFDTVPEGCRFCEWHNPNAANPGQGCPGF